ncbi:YhjD/YihY/BrkB family envelope integrity protein [Allochromatium palmeri]|uniref:YihY family inner membrane protein n=1 Tax=Allochromatium palmeri TaxID=231048 RepID=A0A6N8EE85_9GAMM|nr:YhjD/YihY/BrkB family envelope integrity protein [Allochromatium palmeri]MTW22545.1 YihY family inner membrane protein [Allochromatium palmeri]
MTHTSTLQTRLETLLWGQDLDQLPPWQVHAIQIGRLVHAVARDLTQGHLTLYAMSLVYTTLLSLVPLLAVSFSVLKGFGVHNQIEPLLANALEPLGESGVEITQQLIGFVDRMQVGVLGALGVGMLFYTVVSLIQKIEQSFNHVWRVDEVRPFAQRFTQYLSVLTIGPVLFFSAVGVSASLGGNPLLRSVMDYEPVSWLMELVRLLAPYLMISVTFTFIYRFVPNTQVRLVSALIGGLVAGLLWQSVGALFAQFMAGSTQYTAIYSSLAILILLMIWIYLGWLILLVGSSIAFYQQHPELLDSPEREPEPSPRQRERLALMIAMSIARTHLAAEPPQDRRTLAKAVRQPERTIQASLNLLEDAGYVVRTAAEPAGYVLARPPEDIRVLDILERVRHWGEQRMGAAGQPIEPAITAIESRIETALGESLKDLTLRDLTTEA